MDRRVSGEGCLSGYHAKVELSGGNFEGSCKGPARARTIAYTFKVFLQSIV